MSELRRTVLYPRHQTAGARFISFAGWEMPVQYEGIVPECRAVRSGCGIFDISHMGEFWVSGTGAADALDRVLTARVSALEPGQAAYCLLLLESGGVIDDLIAYRVGPSDFLLVVNAAKISEDAEWMRKHLSFDVRLEDLSGAFSAVAVQGPQAPAIFESTFGEKLPTARNRIGSLPGAREEAWVCTTGYTGEVGFEIVCRNALARELWDRLIDAGCKPCGLGARDVLRLEACYPLNGADLDASHTPLEAGLGFAVALAKAEFIGRDALLRQKEAGLPSRLCALRLDAPMPPLRAHYAVWSGDSKIGETSSGGLSPTLQAPIGLAYLPVEFSKPGTAVEIEIRGRRHPAHVVRKPFVSPGSVFA